MIALVGRCWPFKSYNYEPCLLFPTCSFPCPWIYIIYLWPHLPSTLKKQTVYQIAGQLLWQSQGSGLHNSWLLLLVSLTKHQHFLEPCCRIQEFITWIIIIQSCIHFTVICSRFLSTPEILQGIEVQLETESMIYEVLF